MRSSHYILLLLLLTLPATGLSATEVALIVNRDNPVTSLTLAQVKQIFLGQKHFWPHGNSVTLLLHEEDAIHQRFVQQLLDKSPRQYQLYWKRELFSGTGVPPRRHPDDLAIKSAVAADPDAISYIDAQSLDDSIKQIRLE